MNKLTILVVSQTAECCQQIRDIFELEGHRVFGARNESQCQGFVTMNGDVTDAVIIDVDTIEGFNFEESLQQAPSVRFVLLSSMNHQSESLLASGQVILFSKHSETAELEKFLHAKKYEGQEAIVA